MIIRKMANNKWLVASLLLGMTIGVALVSTMPIYSEAILSRMLVKDLETMQQDRNVYPGSFFAKLTLSQESPETRKSLLNEMDAYMSGPAAHGFALPVIETVIQRITTSVSVTPVVGTEEDRKKSRPISFTSLSGLYDHIKLTDGRMPEPPGKDGVYEVLVTDGGLYSLKAVLGSVFEAKIEKTGETIKFMPVGIFEKKRDDDPYFINPSLSDFSSKMVIDPAVMDSDFLGDNRVPVITSSWHIVLDYSKMELRQVNDFLKANQDIQNYMKQRVSVYQTDYQVPAIDTLNAYLDRASRLRTLMWALNVPVLIMLAFYMFMVANLIAERQKNEIAVLRSRGAARWQIAAAFLVEGLILSAAAWAVGPFVGLILTKVLGASNGFLSFVSRAALPVRITSQAYRYGLVAAGVSLVMLLIPVILATRTTIVGHKQQLARQLRTPLWHKIFLDVILIAIAIYGLYTFRARLDNLTSLGLQSTDLRIDPLQFLVPALFIVGAGLLLLRLYPYLLRLVYWSGRKWWRPGTYATLIQVGRSSGQYQFLMVFLLLTIATGVFSASAARTINNNTEDRIRYGNGADIAITSTWLDDAPPPSMSSTPGAGGAPSSGSVGLSGNSSGIIHYLEPAFEPYEKLPGVEHAAKVFTKKDASFSVGDTNGMATLMGIDPYDFGMTAWFRDGLLDHHLNDYLNLMASDTRAVLISRTLAVQKKAKVGDTIWIGWSDVQSQPFVVYGIIDYFPTFNPNPPSGSVSSGDEDDGGTEPAANAPMLIVGHLSRIQFQLGLEPYQVWLKMKPGFSSADLYQSVEQSKLSVTKLVNTEFDWNKAKNDPFLMALNGILTLGFLLSIIVSFSGFLLYWILSLKGRTLQNGVMRALGLSLRQMIGMLVLEQILTSGIAVAIGIVVGNLASSLYVPNFQIAFNPSTLVPPFRVIADSLDYVRLYAVVVFMLVLGLGILGGMVARTRIHQALKLGED